MKKFEDATLEVVKFEDEIHTDFPDGDIVCWADVECTGVCPVKEPDDIPFDDLFG